MNEFLDTLSDFLEKRRGLLPLIGLGLIVLNWVLQVFPGPGSGWIVDSNLFLHLGLVVSLIGLLLVRVL
jgi:hypothetical protein